MSIYHAPFTFQYSVDNTLRSYYAKNSKMRLKILSTAILFTVILFTIFIYPGIFKISIQNLAKDKNVLPVKSNTYPVKYESVTNGGKSIITPDLKIANHTPAVLNETSSSSLIAAYEQNNCGSKGSDIMILLDKSATMWERQPGGGTTDIELAKQAIKKFIDDLSVNSANRIGLTIFAKEINLEFYPLANGSENINLLKSRIDNIERLYGTCAECAVILTNEEIHKNGREGANKAAVLISDGKIRHLVREDSGGNLENRFKTEDDPAKAIQKTLEKIKSGYRTDKTVFYTIGIGIGIYANKIDSSVFMQQAVDLTGGLYFSSTTASGLSDSFDSVLDKIGKGTGSVEGFVFDDSNRNSIYETTESKLPDWRLDLASNAENPATITAYTDIQGKYTFSEVCDGNYILSIITKSGWSQTLPLNYSPYYITINQGSIINNKNFGVSAGHLITGSIFNDINKNRKKGASESNYIGNFTITSSAGSTTTQNNAGTYSVVGLPPGTYTVSYTSPLPAGYQMIYPLNGPPPTYSITVGPGCKADNTTGAACDAAGNITNLNFAINDSIPWIQSQGMDMRIDNGFTNYVGNSPACTGQFSIVPHVSSNAGIIFSGDKTAEFGNGKASANGWVVGGSGFPELYKSTSSRLSSSYASILTNVDRAGVSLTNLSPICNLENCTLSSNLPAGAYRADGNLTLNGYSFPNNRNYVFLVNGSLTLKGNIQIPDTSTALFTASNDIIVDRMVGSTPSCAAASNLAGFYSADNDVVIQGINDCTVSADKMLIFEGGLFVNAEIAGGVFKNNRDLCGGNYNYPSILFTGRPDFIVSAPGILKRKGFIYSEETN